jgi:hypothetical protein
VGVEMNMDQVHEHIMRMANVNEEQLYDVTRLLRKMGVNLQSRYMLFEDFAEERWRKTVKLK